MVRTFSINTHGKGLHDCTARVADIVRDSGVEEGLCTLFIQHTSASLTIQENADPAVQYDLENWLGRLVKEGDPIYTHTDEGPDDMPAHIKSALTPVSLSIPISGGSMTLGIWQGIYVWEHRAHPHQRRISVHVSA